MVIENFEFLVCMKRLKKASIQSCFVQLNLLKFRPKLQYNVTFLSAALLGLQLYDNQTPLNLVLTK